ncbi:hypothetical protein AVEN_242869-1 [Araneus ventricosus]|uniref:BTB domain-containing protein n=1 Tax=Araneus ventricosus TaxID=182803 RepID=A0A4Y2R6L1_ARAVE|nr:hypothetical protein AVEN_242869-1 [Araneus ventricosus]
MPISKNTKECTEYSQINTPKYVTNLSEDAQGVTPNTINFSTDNNLSDSLLSWKDELMSLCKGHILCDVKLLTKTKSFPSHSLILSIRYYVLRDKIASVVRKKLNNCVHPSLPEIDFQDLDENTVHQMLVFLYTDCIDGLEWERAKKLYFAADKYEILALKEKCSFFLLQNLQSINCCEILLLAEKHQDKDMKKGVQLYIAQHHEEIIDDDHWRKLEKTNPVLSLETFHIMVSVLTIP